MNKIFTSPKKRAFILAEKIAQLVDTKLEISDSLLERDFGELERLQVSRKGIKNFVTSSDRNSESKIIYELSKI